MGQVCSLNFKANIFIQNQLTNLLWERQKMRNPKYVRNY